jgi:hypothetical protein
VFGAKFDEWDIATVGLFGGHGGGAQKQHAAALANLPRDVLVQHDRQVVCVAAGRVSGCMRCVGGHFDRVSGSVRMNKGSYALVLCKLCTGKRERDCGIRIAEYGLRNTDCGIRIAEYGVWNAVTAGHFLFHAKQRYKVLKINIMYPFLLCFVPLCLCVKQNVAQQYGCQGSFLRTQNRSFCLKDLIFKLIR